MCVRVRVVDFFSHSKLTSRFPTIPFESIIVTDLFKADANGVRPRESIFIGFNKKSDFKKKKKKSCLQLSKAELQRTDGFIPKTEEKITQVSDQNPVKKTHQVEAELCCNAAASQPHRASFCTQNINYFSNFSHFCRRQKQVEL